MNKPKLKTCKACKVKFIPEKTLQFVCSYECSIAYTLVLNKKNKALFALKMRREKKEKLDKLKSKSDWLKETQIEFNKYCRLRDEALPCISCQRFHNGQYHAGHYRSIGACPSLRFEESNVHKQCSACNNHLSGNIVLYRINLIAKIGVENVEDLEKEQAPKNYTIDDIKALKLFYKAKIKELQHE